MAPGAVVNMSTVDTDRRQDMWGRDAGRGVEIGFIASYTRP